MSNQNLPVAPTSGADDLGSCEVRVSDFSSYCDAMLNNFVNFAKKLEKKRKRKGKNAGKDVWPTFVFPPRPSGRPSIDITNPLGETVNFGARARGALSPISSGDETETSSKRGYTRGDRTRRVAALKARDGVLGAFKAINSKLRRPTNFGVGPPGAEGSARRALDLTNVQQDNGRNHSHIQGADDIFKKPALPVLAVDSGKAERSSRSRTAREITSSRGLNDHPVASDEEELEVAKSRPSRSTRNKKKANQKTTETIPVDSEKTERSSRSRATREITSSRGLNDRPVASDEEELEGAKSRSPSRSTRNKKKVNRKMTETVPAEPAIRSSSRVTRSIYKINGEGDSSCNLPSVPAKTGKTSKVAQQPRSTYVVPKEESSTSDENRIADQADDGMEVENEDDVPRPLSRKGGPMNVTTVLRERPSNPMDTLDFPDDILPEKETQRGSLKRHNLVSGNSPAVKRVRSSEDLFSGAPSNESGVRAPRTRSKARQQKTGSLKRHNLESGNSPAVKRVRSSEDLFLDAPSNESGVRAPRTRSKARQPVTAPAGSSRSGTSKERTTVLPINQMMKVLSDKSSSRTPGQMASKPVNSTDIKKDKDDALRKKEEEALKKKQELMNQKKEEIRKNRETKVKKVAESRAAVEKEKMLQLEKEKKEKEEKERQAMAELQRKKEEELLKKKLLNQQKAQEAEERRIREEKIRLARLKEQEEEQRRAAEARQRQAEEAERLAALRKAQEKEEEQLRALERERKEREKARVARAVPAKDDPDDIGIDDSDGEGTASRRPCPKWAEPDNLDAALKRQSYYEKAFFPVHGLFDVAPVCPNLREMFGSDALPRPRTSSQFWPKTPPPPGSDPEDYVSVV